ncbi:MAG: hypothetical protein ACTHMS_05320 [Jatrophihabitans sp.]|uniref:hypothetical protein n=1 Tax=Jatrophihabitans sp. TaxID=1932789 RepID=UPI003F7E535D
MRVLRARVVALLVAVVAMVVGLLGAPSASALAGAATTFVNGTGGAVAATVTAGSGSGCGLRAGGSIACWGDAPSPVLSPPAGTYLQLAQSGDTACALAVDGHAVCWGRNAVSPAVSTTFATVSAAPGGGCGVASWGAVNCWGHSWGPVPGGAFRSIATGTSTACGVRVDGTLTCFGAVPTSAAPTGRFTDVSVGPGDTACALAVDASLQCFAVPAAATVASTWTPPLGSYRHVSVGLQHACASRTDGGTVCWGVDTDGETSPPVGVDYLQVAAGSATSCGLQGDGRISCWGAAVGVPGQNFGHPGIAASGLSTCGVTTDSHVVCWGSPFAGTAPTEPVRSVAAGLFDACAITIGGHLRCWGGTGAALQPPDDAVVTQAVVGDSFACALLVGGTVRCWGGTTGGAPGVVGHEPSGSFIALTATDDDVCALGADGQPVCFGADALVPPAAPLLQLSIASGTVCGVTAARQATCTSGVPAIVTGAPSARVRSVTPTDHAACAVLSDSTVTCWGDTGNDAGVVADAPASVTFAALSSGSGHVCGIVTDGTTFCWGDDSQRKAEGQSLVGQSQYIGVGPAPTGALVGGAPYTPVVTAGASGNPVSVAVDPAATAVCAITGGVVSFLSAGSCILTFTEAGNGDFADAETQQTFAVHPTDGAIVFLSTPPAAVVGGPTYTPVAAGDLSGDPMVYSVDPSSTGCTIDGSGVVSFVHATTCLVVAQQSGHPGVAQQSFTVGRGPQPLAIVDDVSDAQVGTEPYTPHITSGTSGAPITVTTDPSATGCTMDPTGMVTFVHATICTLVATQAGDADHLPSTVRQSFPVAPGLQVLSIISPAPHAGAGGAPYRPVVVAGGSGLPVVLSVGDPAGPCSVNGATIVFSGEGPCTVIANQAGNADWAVASPVQQTFSVDKTPQTMTITSAAPLHATVGDAGYRPAAALGESGNAVLFGVDVPNGACTVAGGLISFVHVGTCTVVAFEPGDAIWADATAEQDITVGQGAQSITIATAPSAGTARTVATVGAIGGPSGRPVTFSVDATSDAGTCSVDPDNGVVALARQGQCVIDVDQAASTDYAAAPTQRVSFPVHPYQPVVTVTTSLDQPVFGQSVTATATVGGGATGTVQFTVDGQDTGLPVPVVQGQAVSGVLTDGLGHAPSAGPHVVGATFAPADPAVDAPSSGTQPLTVGQAGTTTVLQVRPSTVVAVVSAVDPGAGTPTGSAAFLLDGRTALGSAPLVHGVATLAATLPTGIHHVSVSYGGDGDFLASGDSTARTDPTVTATVSSLVPRTLSGWYRSAVSITFTCTPGSGALLDPCPSPVVLSTDGAGQSVTRTVHADDGGLAVVTVPNIAIDRTAPAITVRGVRGGATYLGAAPKATCTGSDTASGVASCSVSTRLAGTTVTYRATASDRAGNSRTVTGTYTVLPYFVAGVTPVKGVSAVRAGHSYKLMAVGPAAPRWLAPVASPRRPSGSGAAMARAGVLGGDPAWSATLTIRSTMRVNSVWIVGVKVGGVVHLLTLKVVR